ncbi:MAG: DUF4833 domain-containing protein [Bacteroidetes bacterium]|nr:DUF4833 domain-containing protein [Bacteroidota bacterium]
MNKLFLFCFLSFSVFNVNSHLGDKKSEANNNFKETESTVVNKRLFVIERNMNKNTVCYDAIIKNGIINLDNPIDAYWMDYATDGKRSELNYFQRRMAFGYSIEKANAGNIYVTLKAFDKRKLFVSVDNKGIPHALIKINGIDANLSKIYVTAKPKMYTSVQFIELYGNDVKTAKPVYEKILN